MDITVALLLFSLIIIVYWVMTELFTFFFRLTGLPAEKARFQVISLLTGTGFTTKESQIVMTSRRRRRLARATMLFGYVFNVTVVSALINVFLSMKTDQVEYEIFDLLIPLSTVALIFIFMRVPKVHAWADHQLRRLADRVFDREKNFNAVLLVDNIGTESIAQVTLHHIPDEYRGRSLAETRLRADTGILVMLVERQGGKPMAATADTVFETDDKLTVFGDYKTICQTFHAREHLADD